MAWPAGCWMGLSSPWHSRCLRIRIRSSSGPYINAACVLLGILAGVIVYGVLVIALRILRAEDVRSIPRGEKLIKLLHLK